MRQPGKARTLAQRWAEDEEMFADTPRQVDAEPRWKTDNLAQYGPDATAQSSPDDLSGDDL